MIASSFSCTTPYFRNGGARIGARSLLIAEHLVFSRKKSMKFFSPTTSPDCAPRAWMISRCKGSEITDTAKMWIYDCAVMK